MNIAKTSWSGDGGRAPLSKRAVDLICIAIALPVLLPAFLGLSLMLKCLSRGPVLFKQRRIGFRGRPFECFKFRTMKVDADTNCHREHFLRLIRSSVPMVKLDAKGDPRLIPLGRILRATGFDELPQLYNVLRGEMSLVGPRPSLPYEHETFTPRQKLRCHTLPGLTGLWQVCGKNQTTFDEMIRLDVLYAQTRTIWLDLAILARTVPAVVTQVLETRGVRLLRPVGGEHPNARRPALVRSLQGRDHPTAEAMAIGESKQSNPYRGPSR